MDEVSKVEIELNGESTFVGPDCTIGQLLDELAKKRGQSSRNEAVAVELNAEILPRSQFETTTLKSGDNVEVVTLVGGG